MEVLGKLQNSGYSTLTLWRYKNKKERQYKRAIICYDWNSYIAFIQLYFFFNMYNYACYETNLTKLLNNMEKPYPGNN